MSFIDLENRLRKQDRRAKLWIVLIWLLIVAAFGVLAYFWIFSAVMP